MNGQNEIKKNMMEVQQKIIQEGRSEELIREEGQLVNQLEERRKHEEILWKQKSRVNRLQEGERNTIFFHKAMVHHRQNNRIYSLKDEDEHR